MKDKKSILILLGGMWHDFDGYAKDVTPVLEAVGYRVEATYDLDLLTRLDQAGYDLVLSYTCFYKHREGCDDTGAEKLTDEQLRGLAGWVRSGGALLAAHAATCLGESDPEYGKLLGGVFVSHPEPFTFNVFPLSGKHPITAAISAFEIHDEFYIQEYAPDVEIHMAALYQDALYPMAWSKLEGRGRVAHLAPGHFPEVWNHPAYRQLLLQTTDWLVNS